MNVQQNRHHPQGGAEMTDYHELPEVPKCCATCGYHMRTYTMYNEVLLRCTHPRRLVADRRGYKQYSQVAPHGLCSHWERRDAG